ncbi:hypothetical protein PVAP13_4NG265977 [Panicum virgatum]|uniref:Uncharacterized protein n=1 Tax=Panicum virgatum TaxID=38727 RepID=A0A8T0TEJ4_PANVG|nr:hypothetical protein PVAP13_4NG265977 [Panicum virgatum]
MASLLAYPALVRLGKSTLRSPPKCNPHMPT